MLGNHFGISTLPIINLYTVIPMRTRRKITARVIDIADVNHKESASKIEMESCYYRSH